MLMRMPSGPSASSTSALIRCLVAGAARRDHDQHVDVARHVDQLRIVLVGDAGLRIAAVIDHRHAEGLEPPRDRLADAAHADDADGAVAQRRLASADSAASSHLPARRKRSACGNSRTVQSRSPSAVSATSSFSTSGVLVTTMPCCAGPFGVDVVVADAEARDDLELREARHQSRRHRVRRAGDGRGAHVRRRPWRCIASASRRRSGQDVQIERPAQAVDDQLLRHSDQQHVGLVRPSSILLSCIAIGRARDSGHVTVGATCRNRPRQVNGACRAA